MLRTALSPRWAGYFALAILLSIAFVLLGQWQWGRYEVRQERADRIEAHYHQDPVPIDGVLDERPLASEAEWTRVEATGVYRPEDTVLARNRPHEGTYGSEVLVPLDLADGSAVMVDRGWVANSDAGAEVRPEVPEPPTGEVTVSGWLRTGEPDLERPMPDDLIASINLPELSEKVGGPLRGGYLVRESERETAGAFEGETPAALAAPDTGIGPHMAYAIQWWGGVAVVWIYVWVALRRDAGITPQRPREKKVRIWDEEDG